LAANAQDQEHRMTDETTPQDDKAMSLASAGSVSIGEPQNTGYDEWYCQWYLCPKCEKSNIARWFSYCPDCGAKLQWQA
jgi:hypothetical protein